MEYTRRGWIAVLMAVAVVCAWGLLFGAAAALAGTFTWSGTDSSTANWSVGDNWQGGTAPIASDPADSLVFPGELSGGDCLTTQNDACYASEDDIAGYDVSELTIDDGVGYLLKPDLGNDALTLGSGGLSATTSSASFEPSEIDVPLTLGAGQTWSIDGGSSGQGQLNLDGGVSGTTEALAVQFSNAGYLDLDGGSNNEVGDVTATGTDLGDVGLNAFSNGAIKLGANAELNGSDDNSVTLDGSGIFGSGTVGPLISTSGAIEPGDPTGIIAVEGSVSLNSASDFTPLINGTGTTAGTDYSQLTATGPIDLGNANLAVKLAASPATVPYSTLAPSTRSLALPERSAARLQIRLTQGKTSRWIALAPMRRTSGSTTTQPRRREP